MTAIKFINLINEYWIRMNKDESIYPQARVYFEEGITLHI